MVETVDTAVESVFHTSAPSDSSRFERLQQHLMSFYPADHVVTNARSATFPLFGPELTSFPLCELASRYADHQLGGTLNVPPAKTAPYDEGLIAQVVDREHLARITGRAKS